MQAPRIDPALLTRLYRLARAERWQLPIERFAAALEAGAGRAPGGGGAGAGELERFLTSLHLEDLALACACEIGSEAAWEHVVREQRPALYRAADALEPGGGARDLADSLYAELYGLRERDGDRQSLFRYFQGRSSLATWLRAVLSQRYVDRIRAARRLEPLPEEEAIVGSASGAEPPEPDRARFQRLMRTALDRAIAGLDARDRLRLRCYYAQQLTLAQTGRLLGEHEATVSRQLGRTRRAIREAVERDLRKGAGLNDAQVGRCFECAVEDAGPLDLDELLDDAGGRKKTAPDRSL